MKLRRLTPLSMIGILLLFVAVFTLVCLTRSTAHGADTTTISGTLTVRITDWNTKTDGVEIGIIPENAAGKATGKEIPVKLLSDQAAKRQGKPVQPLHGSKATVTGQMVSGVLVNSSLEVTQLAIPAAFGEQKVLMMNITFSDKPAAQPMTQNQILGVVSNVSNFWQAGSDGKTWAVGTATPWLPIAQASTVCDINTTISQAMTASNAAGYPTTGYNRLVVNWAGNACGWWGLGTVGGNPSTSYINGGLVLQVLAHEMGHGLGLVHSHSGTCSVGGNCVNSSEYGDNHCVMGYSSEPMNAYQVEKLGWRLPTIAATGGTFTLNSWLTTGQPALRMNETYAEYRPAFGVLIHHGTGGESSILLATLTAGQSYTDEHGTRFTAVSTGTAAQVAVAGSGPTPTAVPPTMPPATRTPATPPTATPGPVGTFKDDFNRPDGPLGNGWLPLAGTFAVKGNRAVSTVIGAHLAVAPLTGTNQTAAADFTSWDSNLGPRFGLALRVANSLDLTLCYRATGGSAQVRISKFTNGVEKILASRSLANPQKGVPFHGAASVSGTTASCTMAGVSVSAQVPAVSGGVGLYIWNKTAAVQQVADNYSASAQ